MLLKVWDKLINTINVPKLEPSPKLEHQQISVNVEMLIKNTAVALIYHHLVFSVGSYQFLEQV